MSTDNFYLHLSNVNDHLCTHYIIKSLAQKEECLELKNTVAKIGLVALAEVAAIFDLMTEQFLMGHLILTKLWEFSLPSIDDWENYLQKTLNISLFFLAFIPCLVERQFNIEQLIEPEVKGPDYPEIIKELEQMIITMKPYEDKIAGISAGIRSILAQKELFLSPDIPYQEKFHIEIPNTDGLTQALNRYIFLTNEKNHALLLVDPLKAQERKDCEELHIYFRTLSQLTRKFEYIFDSEDILEVTNLFRGEFYDLESMIGFEKSQKLQAKIFFTMVKLFKIYIKNPESPSSCSLVSTITLDRVKKHDLYSYLMQRVLVLFDLYLEENHPDILMHEIKPINLTEAMLREHFEFPGRMREFKEIYELFSASISRRDCPRVHAANICILKSIERALKA